MPPKRGGSSPPLVACTISPLSLKPVFTIPSVASRASPGEPDDDEEDEEEEEVDGELIGGFRSAGGTCIAVTASLNSSVQYTHRKFPPALSSRSADPTSFLASATAGFRSSTVAPDGSRVDVRLSVLFQSPDGSTYGVELKEGVIDVGAWSFGFAPSIFSFWTGDDFLFGTRVPARGGVQLARRWQLTETWSAALALEDTQATSSSPPGSTLLPTSPGPRMPDIVGRLRFEGDSLEAHLSAAVKELRSVSPGQPVRWGRAAIVGVRWSFELLGLRHAITGQGTWAVDAPVYLGLQSDLRTIRAIVGDNDTTRGFSGALAWTTALSETVSFNLYASHFRLDFPKLGQTGGRAELSGGAANLVWMPRRGLRIGAEVGFSRNKIELPGRAIAIDLSARQATAILWFDRTF